LTRDVTLESFWCPPATTKVIRIVGHFFFVGLSRPSTPPFLAWSGLFYTFRLVVMASRRVAAVLVCGLSVMIALFSTLKWLQVVAPDALFHYLVFLNFAVSPIGYAMVAGCTHGLREVVAAPLNIAGGVALNAIISVCVGAIHKILSDGTLFKTFRVCVGDMCFKPVAHSPSRIGYGAILFAVLGLSTATGLFCALLHLAFADCLGAFKDAAHLHRRLWRRSPWGPRPKEVVVRADVELSSAGECAICLGALGAAPATDPEPCGSSTICAGTNSRWLLELPCKHSFHEACVLRWIDRELSCPLCRFPVRDISKCTRLCFGEVVLAPVGGTFGGGLAAVCPAFDSESNNAYAPLSEIAARA